MRVRPWGGFGQGLAGRRRQTSITNCDLPSGSGFSRRHNENRWPPHAACDCGRKLGSTSDFRTISSRSCRGSGCAGTAFSCSSTTACSAAGDRALRIASHARRSASPRAGRRPALLRCNNAASARCCRARRYADADARRGLAIAARDYCTDAGIPDPTWQDREKPSDSAHCMLTRPRQCGKTITHGLGSCGKLRAQKSPSKPSRSGERQKKTRRAGARRATILYRDSSYFTSIWIAVRKLNGAGAGATGLAATTARGRGRRRFGRLDHDLAPPVACANPRESDFA